MHYGVAPDVLIDGESAGQRFSRLARCWQQEIPVPASRPVRTRSTTMVVIPLASRGGSEVLSIVNTPGGTERREAAPPVVYRETERH